MKKHTTLFIIALMVLVVMPMTLAQEPLLKASLSRYTPAPAEPGSYTTVYIKMENAGNGDAENVTIEVVPEFPFEKVEGGKIKSFGRLGSSTEYVEDFRVLVDPSAPPGINKLKIRFTDNPATGDWTETYINIDVELKQPIIAIDAVQTVPETFGPGQEGKVAITVMNYAAAYLKDVTVKLDLQSDIVTNSLTGTSTVVGEVPFIPVLSSSEKIISRLDAGASHTFTFNLRAYPDATPQLYKIPVLISYTDGEENHYNKTDLIGIVLNSPPKLDIVIDSTTISQESASGNIILKFVNSGIGDIKFLTVTLEDSDQYTILSPSNQVYVGSIDSDDFDTAEFQLKNVDGNQLDIPFTVTYKDANNNDYERTGTARLNLLSQADLTGSSGGGIIWVIIVIVVIGGGIWWLARRRKRKKK